MSYIRESGDHIQPPRIDIDCTLNGVYSEDEDSPIKMLIFEVHQGPGLAPGIPNKKYIRMHISPFSPLTMDLVKVLLAHKKAFETARQEFKQGGE